MAGTLLAPLFKLVCLRFLPILMVINWGFGIAIVALDEEVLDGFTAVDDEHWTLNDALLTSRVAAAVAVAFS